MSTNVKWYYKINDIINNELRLGSNSNLSGIPIKDHQPIVTMRLRGGKSIEIPCLQV